MKKLLFFLVCLMLIAVPIRCYADEQGAGENVADEQESLANEKADEAINSLNDKKDKMANKYDQLMDDVENGKIGNNYDKDWGRNLLVKYYKGYQTFKFISPFICFGSIAIGIIGAFLCKYNKKARQSFIVICIFVVPIFIIGAVFGIGILNSSVL